VSTFTSLVGTITNHPSISYVTSTLNFAFGLQVIIGALIARFILRRIPLIG
jgi:hypothetical protein